jgi:cell division protein FtsB
LKKEKLEIQKDINSLRSQIAMLEKEEEKLKFDEKYIERIAREKFKMVKPGERVFKVVED